MGNAKQKNKPEDVITFTHTQMTETSTVTRVIVLSVNGLLVKTQLMSFSSNTPTSKSTTSAN